MMAATRRQAPELVAILAAEQPRALRRLSASLRKLDLPSASQRAAAAVVVTLLDEVSGGAS